MTDHEEEERLLEIGVSLEGSGLLANIVLRQLESKRENGIEGTTSIEGRELRVEMAIPRDFPCRLPTIRILDADPAEKIPHVTDDGLICYDEGVGGSSSIWRVGDVAVSAVAKALSVVRDGFAGVNGQDYAEEAEWYWHRAGAKKAVVSYVRPGRMAKVVRVFPHPLWKLAIYDRRDAERLESEDPGLRGLFLPLEEDAISAGFDPREWLSDAGIRGAVRRYVSPSNQRVLRARLKDQEDVGWLLIAVPRSEGDQAMIAVECQPSGDGRWLLNEDGSRTEIVPYTVSRLERARFAERGGAAPELVSRRVMLVGCGAIGGYIAESLTRAGIGNLVLVDSDILRPENAFRHVLGMSIPWSSKAEALANALRSDMPDVEVVTFRQRVQELFGAQPGVFGACDIVINAMGDPTNARWLNRSIHGSVRTRMVHAWLEPLGIGGHVLLDAGRGKRGCYECLFVDHEGQEQLHARSDLAARDQVMTTRRGGCGGSFTPYGDGDARRTAELATRVVVETLLSGNSRPRLCSWKGDERAFRAAGYKTSLRYELRMDDVAEQGEALAHEACPVCGRSR